MTTAAAVPAKTKEKVERPAEKNSDGLASPKSGWHELSDEAWELAGVTTPPSSRAALPTAQPQQERYGNSEVARVGAATEPAEREASLGAHRILPESGIQARPRPLAGPLPAAAQAPLRSAGRPLDPAVRDRMEVDLGAHLGDARMHDDTEAARGARDLGAHAFTSGSDVVFADSQYRPGTAEGDALLRHELTHVVQHEKAGEDHLLSADLATPAPAAGVTPPVPPPPLRTGKVGPGASSAPPSSNPTPPPGVTSPNVVELKGTAFFEPSPALASQIKALSGDELYVAVRFGNVADGVIPIRWTDTGYQTPPPKVYFPAWGIPMHHPAFPHVPGAEPTLWIRVVDGVVSGAMGWKTPAALAQDPAKFRGAIPRELLFGGLSGFTNVRLEGEIVDNLWKGRFVYDVPLVSFDEGDFHGTGHLRVVDETYLFDGGIDVPLTGLPKNARMPLEREAGGGFLNRVSGSKSWGFTRKAGPGGRLSASLTATLSNGLMDVRGTGNYAWTDPKNPDRRISGAVTILVTTFPIAKEKVRDRLAGDAPAEIEPAAPGEGIAITGWGQLDLALSDWLTGNAEVIVHPEGYVTARGEILPNKVIRLLKKQEKEKQIAGGSASEVIAGVPILGDVRVEGEAALFAYGWLGPGTLHDLRLTGLISSHPAITNRFEVAGTVSAPAAAGLRLEANASLSAKLAHVKEISSISLIGTGILELKMYAEATAALGRRRGAGSSGDADYYLQAHVAASAALDLALKLMLKGNLLYLWKPKIKLVDRSWTIGGAGARLDFTYVFGRGNESKNQVTATFAQIDFDSGKFLEAVVRGSTAEEKAYEGKVDAEGKTTSDVVNPDAPVPAGPPGSPAPPGSSPAIIDHLDAPFQMGSTLHVLHLSLVSPPGLDMESPPPRERLLTKIQAARRAVRKETELPVTREAKLAALATIEQQAVQVLQAAQQVAHASPYLAPSVPGYHELAALIHQYGEQFAVSDLTAELAVASVIPGQPESILAKYPKLAKDELVKAQVARILGSGVDATTFRRILDHIRSWGYSDDVAVELIGNIEAMVVMRIEGWRTALDEMASQRTKARGGEFVLRYIGKKVGWRTAVQLEVAEDDSNGDRRWDAWINGKLHEFKAWRSWTGFLEKAFLIQVLQDYQKIGAGKDMPLRWVFNGDIALSTLQTNMKAALRAEAARQRAGKGTVDGLTPEIANFIADRIDSIVIVWS